MKNYNELKELLKDQLKPMDDKRLSAFYVAPIEHLNEIDRITAQIIILLSEKTNQYIYGQYKAAIKLDRSQPELKFLNDKLKEVGLI